MSEFEMRGMESDAGDAALRRLLGMILAVADDGVSEGRKLDADLILQPCDQRNADKRRAAKKAFDRIA